MQIQAVHELRKLALNGNIVENVGDDLTSIYKTTLPPTMPSLFNGTHEALMELSYKQNSTDTNYESLRFDFTKLAANMYGIMKSIHTDLTTKYNKLTADIQYLSSQITAMNSNLSNRINSLSSKLSADNHTLSSDYGGKITAINTDLGTINRRITAACAALSSDGWKDGIQGYRACDADVKKFAKDNDDYLSGRIDGLTNTYDGRYLRLNYNSATQTVVGPTKFISQIEGTAKYSLTANYATNAGKAGTADLAYAARWS